MLLHAVAALCLLPLLYGASLAVPEGYVLHESKSHHIRNLHKRRESVRPDAIIPIKIGLTQSGLEDGYKRVLDVSHPSSPSYGKHLSLTEVNELFAPSKDTISNVREWLASAADIDIERIPVSKNGWIAVDLPVRAAERAFHTQYYEHEDKDGHSRIGCDAYYLPVHIQPYIDYVTPGVKSSPRLRKRTVTQGRPPGGGPGGQGPGKRTLAHAASSSRLPPDLQDCGRNITPTCIRALYDIPMAHLNDSVNALGIYESGDYFSQQDLNLFFAEYAPNVPNGTSPIVLSVDGGEAPVAPDDPNNTGESDIDIDMSFSLIYPQNVIIYQVDDFPQANASVNGVLLGFLNTFLDAVDGSYCTYNYMGLSGDSPGLDPVYPDPAPDGYKGQLECGVYNLTRILSISYGEAEADLPELYQQRQCNEWMKLALQGHTVLIASGDYGVASYPGDITPSGCLSGEGQNQTIYNPDFLSSCPYVTSVGATQLYANQTVLDPESVMQDNLGPGAELFASHGGFSNHYTAPAYQQPAINTYFSQHDPGLPYYVANSNASNIGANGGVYNRAGRGIPDISANGAFFRAYTDLVDYHYFGTSLAAPLFASVLTLINEERTAVGKGPIGFINPVLYANPGALHDITNGSNPNCGSAGFHAVPGWDPATGLGTPNYPKLLSLFMSLP
ncbi:hypothetical protein BAUCODRAFT_111098 [Baudoinia panamericana UAMH 10762]|uniref:tripeptidyl-peptidase II n=1 Tax=Baudoinia panamericana (strain UAMH 10762) TaxID=717646 RepID=M2N5J6_BAUPA|nr:uncharacterized protein BAUCODRAFT_111098 [Baudoinia panamericana UAMH 10762]EMC94319.1 hypothetical protein BAUCODRAFT_111098 [Baudoinia panamericana UAMH 10762]